MILPIVAYGFSVLREKASPIPKDYPELKKLIENMYETMYGANGIGLAAPQIGKGIRLFIVDGTTIDDEPDMEDFCMTFINPEIVKEEGDPWDYNEGCLSIPSVREDVKRKSKITIRYQDENFKSNEQQFEGIKARIIQHEYDHIEGVLFTDYLTPLKKRMLKRKLTNISKGNVQVDYRMNFPLKKGR